MEEENTATYTTEEYHEAERDYWRQVSESEGFDVEDAPMPSSMYGMISGLMPYDCQNGQCILYRVLVNLYAKVGLHRYNMLEGTSFQLATLIKFNMLQNCVSSYYITLVAHDAASTTDKTFQVRVDERKYGCLDLVCSVARPKDEVSTKKPFIPHFDGGATADPFFDGELPDWPSGDALIDEKRFYVLKKSEWQATDWIPMYLEVLICSDHRNSSQEKLQQLEILKVAIETNIEKVELLPDERFKAKSANVYITFKGIEEVRAPHWDFEIGEHVERKAIVRRVINEHTGGLTLLGQFCGGIYRPPPPSISICRRDKKKRKLA